MDHIEYVRQEGLYDIAALAAGGAIQAARLGLESQTFGAIRPPGHHASHDSCWGFCYFNNMAVALLTLKEEGLIETATILDFDLHYGDGNVNILDHRSWVTICNPTSSTRDNYLKEVEIFIKAHPADIIGISAGFDHHLDDWGGLLHNSLSMGYTSVYPIPPMTCIALLTISHDVSVANRLASLTIRRTLVYFSSTACAAI